MRGERKGRMKGRLRCDEDKVGSMRGRACGGVRMRSMSEHWNRRTGA